MTTDHDELRDLVAAAAFDAVTPAERRTVARHLGACAPCATEAARLHETVRLLDMPPGPDTGPYTAATGTDAGTGTEAGTVVGAAAGDGTGAGAGAEVGGGTGTDAGAGAWDDTGPDVGTDAWDGTGAGAWDAAGPDVLGDAGTDVGTDVGTDAGGGTGTDAGVDAWVDALGDAGTDVGTDAGGRTGTDAVAGAWVDALGDAGTDVGTDAGGRTGTDAVAGAWVDALGDAGTDVGTDAGGRTGADAWDDAWGGTGTDAWDRGGADAGARAGAVVGAGGEDVVAGLFGGRRRPGHALRPPAVPVAGHAAAYAAAVAALTALLPHVDGTGGHHRWKVPVVHDWDVQATLAHLLAADEQLAGQLGVEPRVPPSPVVDGEPWEAYWNRRTADTVRHELRHAPGHTRAAWQAQAAALLAAPEAHDPERAARPVALMGMLLPVADHFAVRAFETWIHTDDIGRALGLHVPPPPAPHLERLVGLAVGALGQALGPAAPPVRCTVTGIGAWTLGAGIGPVRAELALEAVEFCFLAGGRRAPDTVPHTATGDAAAVRNVLERTAALAWL
ncbi:maleylpyruvate isomerase family mycothiol-dependent enzyme [Streptomyces sp. NBC_00582]|uniref:maleylpyruvate isomerase family mycothiol-dependent enzyme n=1 Tax=Streptomyces sp. NBC_00582 TaxID=2975783 RepID=UPI002E81BAF6|nr:maleylpyruvate isomerase family mycothiol-dependent enzyme [Streptomyces sp. NBC_00582]